MTQTIMTTLERARTECDYLLSIDPEHWSVDQGRSLDRLRFIIATDRYRLLTGGQDPDTNVLTVALNQFVTATDHVTDGEIRPVIDQIVDDVTTVINAL